VQASYANIKGTFETSFARVDALGADVARTAAALQGTLPALAAADSALRRPLAELRARIEAEGLQEYAATGKTPARRAYAFPTALPRTDGREALLARLRVEGGGADPEEDEESRRSQFGPSRGSPGKGFVLADGPRAGGPLLNRRAGSTTIFSAGAAAAAAVAAGGGGGAMLLREISANTLAMPPPILEAGAGEDALPPLKKLHVGGGGFPADAKRKRGARTTVAGLRALGDRENVTLPNLSASVGVGAVHPGVGRRLRSHERNNVH
jgi:kinesin family protein 11